MKRILYILVFLCVSVAAASLYVSQFTGKPNTIDCMKGREAAFLMGGLHDTMNDPPKPGCPGYDDMTQGEIGTYKLGPYTFNIPRDYLWQGKYNEGEVEGLYLFIEYPSMKPAIEQFKEPGIQDDVKVTLKYIQSCKLNKCVDPAQNWYNSYSYQKPSTKSFIAKSSETASSLKGFSKYKNIRKNRESYQVVHFKGDSSKPDDFMLCEMLVPSENCRSIYEVKKDLFLEYRVHQSFLTDKKDIEEKLSQFIHNMGSD